MQDKHSFHIYLQLIQYINCTFTICILNMESSQFQFLHFGACGLHETNPAVSISSFSLDIFPSFLHSSIFFICYYPPFLFFCCSSSTLSLGVPTQNFFCMAEESFLSVRPIHCYFHSFICTVTFFSCVYLHSLHQR